MKCLHCDNEGLVETICDHCSGNGCHLCDGNGVEYRECEIYERSGDISEEKVLEKIGYYIKSKAIIS